MSVQANNPGLAFWCPVIGEPIEFFVPGLPAPQGSKRIVPGGGRTGGRPILIESNDAAKRQWRTTVSIEARRVALELRARGRVLPLAGPIVLGVRFFLPRPASAARRAYPHTKPDLSKLLRALEDSLTGVLIVDDARIVQASVAKEFGEPGAWVWLGEVAALLPKPARASGRAMRVRESHGG